MRTLVSLLCLALLLVAANSHGQPLPRGMRAHASLYLKVPRQKPFVWEGALWLYRPETLTFEAVNEFGSTLFYFRYTQDRGWIVEQAGKTKKIHLPVEGATLVSWLLGDPLPTSTRKSYDVEQSEWQQKGPYRYPKRTHFHTRKKRVQFKLTIHDAELTP